MNKSLLLFIIIISSIKAETYKEYETEVTISNKPLYSIGDVSTEEYTGISTSINIDDTNNNELLDYLDTDTDLDIRQSGSLGSISTVSIRGSSPSQVNVYFDGVLLNTGTGGYFDLSNIDVSNIKRIDVYKGTLPINLGGGAIGGAINLVSRANNKTQKLFKFNFGSLNYIGTNLLYSDKKFLTSVNYFYSGNNFVFLNDNGTEFNLADDKYEERNHNDILQVSFLTKYNLIDTSKFKLYPSINYFRKMQHLATWNNIKNPQTELGTEIFIASLNTEYLGKIPNKSILSFKFNNEQYQDPQGIIGLGRQDNSYKTFDLSYKHYFEYFLSNNLILKANLYTKKEFYTQKNNISDTVSTNNTRFALVPAFELYYKLSFITVNPSIIYEHYLDSFSSSKKYYDVLEPRLGIKTEILRHLSLFSNIGKYFRIATFYELFGDRGFIVGNSSLNPETAINFDLGTEFKLDALHIKVSYFRSYITDVISYVYDARGIGKAINLSNAIVNGLETSIEYRYKNLVCNYSYSHKKPISKDTLNYGNILPGRFLDKSFFKTSYVLNNFTFWYSFLYEWGMFYDSANVLESPAKYVHSLGVDYKYKPLFVSFNIKNLLNKNYQDYHRYYTPGRVYYLSIGVNII